MMSNSVIDSIKSRIEDQLKPTILKIIDDSADHLGHSSAPEGAGHYTVIIACSQFEGQGMVACHRLVYAAVGDLMPNKIHALRIQIAQS